MSAGALTLLVRTLDLADPARWRAARLQPLWKFLVGHPGFAGGALAALAGAWLGIRFGKAALLWLVGKRVRRTYGHLDPRHAAEDRRRYRELITEDRRMLAISIRGLAREAGLPLRVAWYICEKPGFLPRPEVTDRICEVLMTNPRRLRDGSGYGPECTLKRMLKYHDLGLVALTRSQIRKASERKRRSLLCWVERRRRKQLALPQDPRDHE